MLVVSKPLRIRFDKTDGFIRIYDVTTYLTLFSSEKYDAIYDRIRCLISLKSGITCIISHYFAKIKVYSYNSLPIEKNIDKGKNHYYYKIFLEKCFYQLVKK